MDTFLAILTLIGLFVVLALLPMVWYFKDRAVDGRVRRAAMAHLETPAPEAPADLPQLYARASRIPLRPWHTAGRAY